MIVLLFVLLFIALYLVGVGFMYRRWLSHAESGCNRHGHGSCEHEVAAGIAGAFWVGALPLLWGFKLASKGEK